MISPKYIPGGGNPKQGTADIQRASTDIFRKSYPIKALRIGAVSYLNSKPLVREFKQQVSTFDYDLKLDYPSRLAEGLRLGEYDVALVPSVEYLLGIEAGLDYEIVSNACVAARGPVLSVKVFFRTHPGKVKTLLLDEGSRTSAMLTKIMLAERFGVYPASRQLDLDASPWEQHADAMLVIGDRAMQSPEEEYEYVWDLGEEWLRWTGYPFVFAMWVARGHPTENAELWEFLERVRDRGVSNIKLIAAEEATKLGITEAVAVNYLSKHLHFTMKSAERRGMELYFELARGYFKNR